MQSTDDIAEQKFGKLTAISRIGKATRWNCKCDCGKEVIALSRNLITGRTNSCGECSYKNLDRTSHGLSYTRLHKIWDGMKYRCNNAHSKIYEHYGGRGIKLCDEWNDSFISFYNWAMDNGYSEDLSIDRIDVDGNYEPSNCRWANAVTQMNNTSTNIYYDFHGQKMTLADIAREIGMSRSTLYARVKLYGYSLEEAVSFPVGKIPLEKTKNKRYLSVTWNGRTQTLMEWANELGIDRDVLYGRIFRRNWEIERAFTNPVKTARKAG